VGGIYCSIIIPTLYEEPIVNASLPPVPELANRGIEVIIVWDRWGWKSPSRSCNVGAAVARGDILCFVDDDAGLDFDGLLEAIKDIRDDRRSFYWATEPHILIIAREVFFSMGGYDERYGLPGNWDVEMRERLKFYGYRMKEFPYDKIKPQHLRPGVRNKKRFYRMQKQLTLSYLRYRSFPLRRVMWRKNPLELARRIIWALEWALIQRWRRRSIFTR
jgi:glycosyltransferase involved in cell wall biosynthesis